MHDSWLAGQATWQSQNPTPARHRGAMKMEPVRGQGIALPGMKKRAFGACAGRPAEHSNSVRAWPVLSSVLPVQCGITDTSPHSVPVFCEYSAQTHQRITLGPATLCLCRRLGHHPSLVCTVGAARIEDARTHLSTERDAIVTRYRNAGTSGRTLLACARLRSRQRGSEDPARIPTCLWHIHLCDHGLACAWTLVLRFGKAWTFAYFRMQTTESR